MRNTREATLGPYPGRVVLCSSRKAFLAVYELEGAEVYCSETPPITELGGCMVHVRDPQNWTYIVWAQDQECLVHELSHVVLEVFKHIGADPRGCSGEPFCYLLQSLYATAQALTWAGK